ncbi:MAG: 1-(5-phosphoribosyl)-5-[(5-phosphoribosylamino)methylideneamino]imidazole-4-carboxamide isomerase [Desulfobacterales bacterium]|nr:1-(5-phosphoribosyl)-5-[(5-phosphoribosylamino)methylideneamino]imidazole-4-carboxamide isomerase [Desulfobacterales bacterium]
MIVIPAVDIKNGKCVRLLQGRMDQVTVFSDDPTAMANKWESVGAELIHVVDLDGAVQKSPQNIKTIKRIVDRLHIPIQVGGGIRDVNTIEMYLESGVQRVVIGTAAIRHPELIKNACRKFPNRIVIGIDARNGLVAIEGWVQTTQIQAVELASQFEDCGVAAINFTDIQRDGMMTGPNIEQTQRLAEQISIPVVASGGVSSLKDIENLLPLEKVGVTGVITGKALYDGRLDLKAAIQLTQSSSI